MFGTFHRVFSAQRGKFCCTPLPTHPRIPRSSAATGQFCRSCCDLRSAQPVLELRLQNAVQAIDCVSIQVQILVVDSKSFFFGGGFKISYSHCLCRAVLLSVHVRLQIMCDRSCHVSFREVHFRCSDRSTDPPRLSRRDIHKASSQIYGRLFLREVREDIEAVYCRPVPARTGRYPGVS